MNCFSQLMFISKDTLRFTTDSSYARAIVRYNNELVFGTSKTGVISYNEQTKSTKTIIAKNSDGEFRDLAINKGVLYAMISGKNGIVYQYKKQKTQIIFQQNGLFLDDILLSKNKIYLLGDPINNHFFIAQLAVNKKHIDSTIKLSNQPEEACYAASGTTALILQNGNYGFVSGGISSARFHLINWQTKECLSTNLPMTNGLGAGPFSLYFQRPLNGVIVGGNYTNPSTKTGTACFTTDGGKTWQKSETSGYRSCVTGNEELLFACGTNGIDFSTDGGKTWYAFDNGNFCAMMLEKNKLYATTNKGYCVVYQLNNLNN
jgi:hypothetical protein